jgi:succinate dehydrogenase / fumarate reductase cytochrome b subunit
MSTADASVESSELGQLNPFLLRRLHSLTGVIPVGVFLCFHLFLNATVVFGGDKFQSGVHALHALGKLGILVIVEVVGIFIPILFHGILGIWIWRTGRQNMLAFPYRANIRYTLQRWTALITFAFILYHVWQMHWLGGGLGGGAFDPHNAAASAAAAVQAHWWVAPIYALGVAAAVFHLANGIWTFLITWGVAISRAGQRRAGYLCALLGLGLAAFGFGALVKLRNTDPKAFQTGPMAGTPADVMQPAATPPADDPWPPADGEPHH